MLADDRKSSVKILQRHVSGRVAENIGVIERPVAEQPFGVNRTSTLVEVENIAMMDVPMENHLCFCGRSLQ